LLRNQDRNQSMETNRKFLPFKSVLVLNHSPHSSNLALCDYFSFPKLRMKLRGKKF